MGQLLGNCEASMYSMLFSFSPLQYLYKNLIISIFFQFLRIELIKIDKLVLKFVKVLFIGCHVFPVTKDI